jgi:pimeloyl-ACP methyl ester carboxylesterase
VAPKRKSSWRDCVDDGRGTCRFVPPELPELAGVRHSYIDVNGFRAHIAEAGDPDADPVVMLHGWPQHWWCWHKVIPPLAERYRVICPDLRGHGWSDAPHGPYDKPQLAKDLIATLDVLGLDRVRLVGHDWGAMTGFLACMNAPERFDRFLALGIAPPFGNRDPKRILDLWRLWYQLPISAPLLGPRLMSREGVIRFAIMTGSHKRGSFTRTDLDLYAQALAERPHVTVSLYRTFLTREIAQIARGRWAKRLRVPTRIMVGEHEPIGDAERMLDAKQWADDLRVHELPGVGHFTPEEAPEAVSERALSFFA